MAAPTTGEIYQNLVAQMQSAINQKIPLLPKSFLRVLAKSLAAVFTILYKYGSFQFLQIFAATATIKDTEILGRTVSPLKEWGVLFGAGLPKLASSAELQLELTVSDQTGQIKIGTQFQGTSNGVLYLSTEAIALDAALVYVPIVAAADASGESGDGVIGNLEPGASVTFVNPIAQVNRTTSVYLVLALGVEAESEQAYRQRVIDRFQKRPQGGAYADYEIWSELTPGVLNAYPYTGLAPGTVDVYIEAADTVDGIPGGVLLTAVKASIELDTDGKAFRRPVNAFVNVRPITRSTFDVQVVGLVVDNAGAVQANITESIDSFFKSREPFITGISVPPRNDRITNSAVAGIVDDIVSSVNGVFSNVVIKKGSIPVSLYALGVGEKAKSNVSFV